MTPRINGIVEGHFPVDQDPYPTVGVELHGPFAEGCRAALRSGYNGRAVKNVSGLSGLTLGFGLDIMRLRLDYAWVPVGDLGSTHRASMGVRF
jgi:hypothetical protein